MASFCPTCSLASGSVSIILLTMIWWRSPILSPSSPWHLALSPSLFFLKTLSSFEFHDTLSLEFYSSSQHFPESSVSFVGFCFPFTLIGAIVFWALIFLTLHTQPGKYLLLCMLQIYLCDNDACFSFSPDLFPRLWTCMSNWPLCILTWMSPGTTNSLYPKLNL